MSTGRRASVVAATGGLLLGALLWWLLPAPPPEAPRARAVSAPVATVRATVPSPSPSPAVGPRPERAVPPATDPTDVPTPDTPSTAWLVVDVVDPDGRPAERGRVVPEACPGFGYAPAKGMHYADPGPCVLRAYRIDGVLRTRSDAVEVDLRAGDVAYTQLQLEATRTGGIGIRFRPTPDGMRVMSVVEGAPAWEAGLEVGDVVVSVDGEPVGGMDSEGFVDAMTGAEGTDVRFEIRYADEGDDVTEEIAVTRRFLEG